MADELLPKVDLWQVSDGARQVLKALVSEALNEALAEQGLKKRQPPPGALRAPEAAIYLGVGRSRFYALLRVDKALQKASFTVGKARCWPIAALDAWMQARQAVAAA